MTEVDEHGRPEPPQDADEVTTLRGFLDFLRATLRWKCEGLDAAGLTHRVGSSTLTLGGLLKHMALVEWSWFSRQLHGEDGIPPWSEVDWQATPDWDFESAADDSPEELLALWERSVDRARQQVDAALAAGGLDQPAQRPWPDGSAPSLRWILVHMIEEYARHNGHADLLREDVDGATGE